MELGPIQQEDKLVLQALIKMTCPKVLVEFGFLRGDSARAILEVMRSDAKLISYDTHPIGIIEDPRLTIVVDSQENFRSSELVDFIFLDASHDEMLNRATFRKLEPLLNDDALIIVHDTGLWKDKLMDTGGQFVDGGYAHRPQERLFVNWIHEYHPEFQQIHLHTLHENRHGLTVLQKYKTLA